MTGRQIASSEINAAVARGLALFLGAFALANLAAKSLTGFDANLWWVDLRAVPSVIADGLTLVLAGLLVGFGVRPATDGWRRVATALGAGLFAGIAIINSVVFWMLLVRGDIRSAMPVPATAGFAVALAFIAWVAWRKAAVPAQGRWLTGLVAASCALLFPVVQVFCFGKTDYRRPADVAVVFGARVYADGRLSDAVGDRVRTAAQLHRQGLVREILMSGGPGDGAVHETTAMRDLAVRLGVPADAITLDPDGMSTAATVRNTLPRLARQRVLVVSEFYHLPRIKLAYARAGREVYTVPAQPRHWLRAWPLRSVVREVPAFWVYYLRALTDRTEPDASSIAAK